MDEKKDVVPPQIPQASFLKEDRGYKGDKQNKINKLSSFTDGWGEPIKIK
jgi:hypothetical protein